jgi:hypothetical protein
MNKLPTLEGKHMIWIIDAAGEHFDARVKEAEADIARHERFISEPLVTSRLGGTSDRVELIERQREYLRQYRDIVVVLRAWRMMATDVEAKKFADQFAEYVKDSKP